MEGKKAQTIKCIYVEILQYGKEKGKIAYQGY
jgi:hypothetical protein